MIGKSVIENRRQMAVNRSDESDDDNDNVDITGVDCNFDDDDDDDDLYDRDNDGRK